MAFKRYIAEYRYDNCFNVSDFVIAKTKIEAKRRIKQKHGRKATKIIIKGEG